MFIKSQQKIKTKKCSWIAVELLLSTHEEIMYIVLKQIAKTVKITR